MDGREWWRGPGSSSSVQVAQEILSVLAKLRVALAAKVELPMDEICAGLDGAARKIGRPAAPYWEEVRAALGWCDGEIAEIATIFAQKGYLLLARRLATLEGNLYPCCKALILPRMGAALGDHTRARRELSRVLGDVSAEQHTLLAALHAFTRVGSFEQFHSAARALIARVEGEGDRLFAQDIALVVASVLAEAPPPLGQVAA